MKTEKARKKNKKILFQSSGVAILLRRRLHRHRKDPPRREEHGERVVEAIREEHLYILTHPDFLPMIRSRMDAILEHGEKGSTLH